MLSTLQGSDLVVFGERAGRHAGKWAAEHDFAAPDPERIEAEWSRAIDAALGSPQPCLRLRLAIFENLTARVVTHKTKKGKHSPEHRFFDLSSDDTSQQPPKRPLPLQLISADAAPDNSLKVGLEVIQRMTITI